jgi:hypothetical protein
MVTDTEAVALDQVDGKSTAADIATYKSDLAGYSSIVTGC